MDEQFNLAAALADSKKAENDRDFYMGLVSQGGAASPIAAYLAGVSGAKAATTQGKIAEQQAAEEAASNALKRKDALQKDLNSVLASIDDGSIGVSAGAAILGPLFKELGSNLKSFDAENKTLVYENPDGEMEEVSFRGWSNKDLQKAEDLRIKAANAETAAKRAQTDAEYKKENIDLKMESLEETKKNNANKQANEKRKLDLREQAQKDQKEAAQNRDQRARERNAILASKSGGGGSGSQKQYTTLSDYKRANTKVFEAYGTRDSIKALGKISDEGLQDFVSGVGSLKEADREAVKGQVNDVITVLKSRGIEVNNPYEEQTPTEEGTDYGEMSLEELLGGA